MKRSFWGSLALINPCKFQNEGVTVGSYLLRWHDGESNEKKKGRNGPAVACPAMRRKWRPHALSRHLISPVVPAWVPPFHWWQCISKSVSGWAGPSVCSWLVLVRATKKSRSLARSWVLGHWQRWGACVWLAGWLWGLGASLLQSAYALRAQAARSTPCPARPPACLPLDRVSLA